MAYRYYTDEYQEYAAELKDIASLKAYKDNLSDNVQTVSDLQEQLQSDVEGMAGESYNELVNTTIGTILTQVEETKRLINDSLEPTIQACERLKGGLEDIKESEDSLIENEDDYSELKRNPVSKGNLDKKTGIYDNQANYNSYLSQLNTLGDTITKLIEICEQLKVEDDADIETIKAFNTAVLDFSSQLFSLSITLGNTDFSNFSNLTTEEKEALVQTFIDALTDKYNEVAALREQTLECFDYDNILLLAQALTGMEIGNGVVLLDIVTNAKNGKFNAQDFLQLMEALTTPIPVGHNGETRNIMEVIGGYFNGESWEESGMMYLYYLNHGVYDPSTEKKYIVYFANTLLDEGEQYFYINGEKINGKILNEKNGDISSYIEAIKEKYRNSGNLEKLTDYYNTLVDNYNKYNEYTYEMTTTNTTIYNLQQLKKHIPYFEYAAEPDYADFEYDPNMFTEEWLKSHKLDEGIADGYHYDELFSNMNEEEKKMFAYTLYKNNGDISAGREFLKGDAARINQRIGYEKATEFLEWINSSDKITKSEYIDHLTDMGYTRAQAEEMAKDVPNVMSPLEEGWDRVCDTFNVFGKGVVCGGNEFVTNIQSLWDPSKVMTTGECETAAIIQLLGDPESPYYDELLYGSFNVGKYIGKEGVTDVLKAIPATKAIGYAIDTVENLGEKRKNYFRATDTAPGESYFGSLVHASLDTLTDVTVDAVMKTDKVKNALGGLGLGEEATKVLSSSIGGFTKNETKYAINTAINYAEYGKLPTTEEAISAHSTILFNTAADGVASLAKTDAGDFLDDHGLGFAKNAVVNYIGQANSGLKAGYKENVAQSFNLAQGEGYDAGAVWKKTQAGAKPNKNAKFNQWGGKITNTTGEALNTLGETVNGWLDENDYSDYLEEMAAGS